MGSLRRKNNGITLVALVITVIILLILAGITIAMLAGENGILNKSKQAKQLYEEKTEEELRRLTQMEASMNTKNYDYYDKNNKKVVIPAGFAVSQVEGENIIKEGLVVIDKNGNEFVWIEVPEAKMPQGLKFEDDSDYITLEQALKEYVYDYKKENYSDEWYSEEQGFKSKEKYNELKNKILKSIYENKGFYVGRYEVGSFDPPVTEENISRKAVIQKRAFPYNNISCKNAQAVAERLGVENKKSSLMLGIQWDLICKYLEENAVELGSTNEERKIKIKNDSTEWGNYYNAEFPIRGKGKYAIRYASTSITSEWRDIEYGYIKPSMGEEGKVLLQTGIEKRNSALNIYDIAGNMYEWTLEKRNTDNRPIKRSGNAYGKGDYNAMHARNATTSTISNAIGFRVILY